MSVQQQTFEEYAASQGMPLNKSFYAPSEFMSGLTRENERTWKAAQAAMPVDLDTARYRILCAIVEEVGGARVLSEWQADVDAEIARRAKESA